MAPDSTSESNTMNQQVAELTPRIRPTPRIVASPRTIGAQWGILDEELSRRLLEGSLVPTEGDRMLLDEERRAIGLVGDKGGLDVEIIGDVGTGARSGSGMVGARSTMA